MQQLQPIDDRSCSVTLDSTACVPASIMMGVREGASWVVCLLLGLALLLKLDELGAEAGRPIIVCVATEGGVESAPAELPLCGSKFRNISVDCSGWPSYHTAGYVGQAEIAPPAPSGGAAMLSDPDDPAQAHQVGSPRPFTELFPCTSRGQVPGLDCWPSIGRPPPLCIQGTDCFDAPPGPAPEHVNHAETSSTTYHTSV